MTRRARIAAAGLVLILAATGCTAPRLDDVAATGVRVDSVADGDTLTIRDAAGFPTVVRLLGIDAPEVAHDGKPAECGAQAAKDALTQLTKGHKVNLYTDPGSDRTDRYGRLLAYVEDPLAGDTAGGDVALRLIQHGYVAAWCPAKAVRPSRADRYEAAQRDTERSRVGSWRTCPNLPG